MGKIFKALLKSENKNLVKSTQGKGSKNGAPDIKIGEPPAKSKPAAPLNDRRMSPERFGEDRGSAIPANESKASVQPDLRPPIEDPPSQTEPGVEPSVEQRSTQRLRKNPEQKKAPIDNKPVEPGVAPETGAKIDESRKAEGKNIALVKHEVSDSSSAVQGITSQSFIRDERVDATGIQPARSREGVKVRYSRTKVQTSDPQKLKDNKVLSVFEDFETTNQFKILRTQVLRRLKAIGGNCLLVTSANPYEGKTFTSINLGVSIAKEFDRTVLIIDADIRRPTKQHTDFSTKFFSLNVEKGLTDYLEGDADIEEVLINPGIDKLTLIPGGTPVDNSPELLNSARMEEMMSEIKSRYPSDRLVIVDGPAILHFPDALILCRYVDGVLPVVESERTPADNIKKMMNQLKETKILGVVLNKNRA